MLVRNAADEQGNVAPTATPPNAKPPSSAKSATQFPKRARKKLTRRDLRMLAKELRVEEKAEETVETIVKMRVKTRVKRNWIYLPIVAWESGLANLLFQERFAQVFCRRQLYWTPCDRGGRS